MLDILRVSVFIVASQSTINGGRGGGGTLETCDFRKIFAAPTSIFAAEFIASKIKPEWSDCR